MNAVRQGRMEWSVLVGLSRLELATPNPQTSAARPLKFADVRNSLSVRGIRTCPNSGEQTRETTNGGQNGGQNHNQAK